MDHAVCFFQLAGDLDQARAHDFGSELLEDLGPYDDIGNTGLVFECHEDHTFGRSWALPYQNQSGDCDLAIVACDLKRAVGGDASLVEISPQERHGMRFQRQRQIAVIVNDMLTRQHRRQCHFGFFHQINLNGIGQIKERQVFCG